MGWLNWPVVHLTQLATDGAIFLVVGLVLAIVWRRPWFFVALVTADLAADGLSYLLRQWIGRDRPPLVYPEPRPLVHLPNSGAFPSGHASAAFASATVIAWASRRLAIPAYALAVVVAWSRVYVGVHFPLDVLGGAALGTLMGTLLVLLVRGGRFDAGGGSATSTARESSGPTTAQGGAEAGSTRRGLAGQGREATALLMLATVQRRSLRAPRAG